MLDFLCSFASLRETAFVCGSGYQRNLRNLRITSYDALAIREVCGYLLADC
jgi:hypothetical protein